MRPSHLVIGSFEALAESAPDAIVTIDETGTILFANASCQRILGYEPSELVGQTMTIIVPERLRAAHNAGLARYMRTGRKNIPWTGVSLPGRRKDGTEVPLEVSFGEFVDEESGARRFSGFMRDVSDRERSRKELEAARAAAEQALQELGTVGRVLDIALASGTYEGMLRELLAGLRRELNGDEATILLVDDRSNELVVQLTDGIDLDQSIRIPIGEGLTGQVASSGRAIVVEDLSGWQLKHDALKQQMASLVAVPIRSDGKLVGVLHVGSRKRRSFTQGEVRILDLVADRVGGVVARTRLYQAERRAREDAEAAQSALQEKERQLLEANAELEERAREELGLRTLAQSITGAVRIHEVMHQIAEGALAVSGARGVFVEQIVDADNDIEVVAASGEGVPAIGQKAPYPGSLTDEIISRREPMFFVKLEGYGAAMAPYVARGCDACSALVAPLFADQRLLGSLVLLRAAEDAPFDQRVMARIRTLADLASISLQRLVALAESERRRGEAEAAVRSRDDVLSVVSHDLRNPVSTVAMSAALLGDSQINLSEEQRRKQIDIIGRSAQRMNRLIQDLLDVARIEGGRLTITCRCEDMNALGNEAFESFREVAAAGKLTLKCEIRERLPRAFVDRDRILQVLSNYLNNAVKFTPSGGQITLRGEPTTDGGTRFTVSDTGPGIEREHLPHMFSRFWQARKTAHMGSGLGLAIAKGIIDAHHGRVFVESAKGKGSSFGFELPFAKECSG